MSEDLDLVPKTAMRLDLWLSQHYKEYSRSYFQQLLEEGLVLVNGQQKPKRYLVQEGDEVEVEFSFKPSEHLIPQDLPLDILYEDEHLWVINKAAGMVVHPGAGQSSHTLANALAYLLGKEKRREVEWKSEDLRAGIVHRLDKDTSGVMVAAKTLQAHAKLVTSFSQREVNKTYLCLVCKRLPPDRVDLAIERDPHHRQRMIASGHGKEALTLFKPIKSFEGDFPLHLVEAELKTGRTHQIRVHLKACDAPLLGDEVYGWEAWNRRYKLKRQMLHSHHLSFIHPIKDELMRFQAPLPLDMKNLLAELEASES